MTTITSRTGFFWDDTVSSPEVADLESVVAQANDAATAAAASAAAAAASASDIATSAADVDAAASTALAALAATSTSATDTITQAVTDATATLTAAADDAAASASSASSSAASAAASAASVDTSATNAAASATAAAASASAAAGSASAASSSASNSSASASAAASSATAASVAAALASQYNGIRLAGVYSLSDSGAVGDGVTDDAATINTWLATLSPGALVYVPSGLVYLISGADLTVPNGVMLYGATSPLSKDVANTLTGASGFVIATNRTIRLGVRCRLRDLLIYQQGLPTAPSTDTAIAEVATWPGNGIGIMVTQDGTVLENLLVLGFATGIKSTVGRFRFSNLWMDNYVCCEVSSVGDVAAIDKLRCEPFWSVLTASVSSGGWHRPGFGLYGIQATACYVTQFFAFCYANPIVCVGAGFFVSNSGFEFHNIYGNGTADPIGYRLVGHGDPNLAGCYFSGDWGRCISVEAAGQSNISDISIIATPQLGIYCAGASATPTVVTIGGTPRAGDTVTLTFTSASLTGSPVSVTYTVVAGDTTSTIAAALETLVNRVQSLIVGKVYAIASAATLTAYWPADVTLTCSASATGTTTASTASGTAQPGSYGQIRAISAPLIGSNPILQFGDTVGVTNNWSVVGIAPGSGTVASTWISTPAGSPQQALLSLSGVPTHQRTGTFGFGTVVGTDGKGAWTLPAGTVTSKAFVFAVAYPWTPSVQLTTDDPTIVAAVSAVSTTGFTASFNTNAAGHTIYYRVDL